PAIVADGAEELLPPLFSLWAVGDSMAKAAAEYAALDARLVLNRLRPRFFGSALESLKEIRHALLCFLQDRAKVQERRFRHALVHEGRRLPRSEEDAE